MYIPRVPASSALTPRHVAETARDLIGEIGLESFSMRKLAAVLDVNPMTIYLRFESKDALLQAVAEASLEGLELPAPAGPWLDQTVDLAVALRAHLVSDREMLRLHNDPTRLSAGVLGAIDRGLELMTEAGYRDAAAVEAFRQLFWHTVGGALVAVGFDRLPAASTDLAGTFAASDAHHVRAHAEHFGPIDAEQLFRSTTRTLAAGLAAAAPKEPAS